MGSKKLFYNRFQLSKVRNEKLIFIQSQKTRNSNISNGSYFRLSIRRMKSFPFHRALSFTLLVYLSLSHWYKVDGWRERLHCLEPSFFPFFRFPFPYLRVLLLLSYRFFSLYVFVSIRLSYVGKRMLLPLRILFRFHFASHFATQLGTGKIELATF